MPHHRHISESDKSENWLDRQVSWNAFVVIAILWVLGWIAVAVVGIARAEELPPPIEPIAEKPSGLARFGFPEGSVIHEGDSWCLAFDGRTRLARWTLRHLTPATLAGTAARPDTFHVDSRVPDEFRPSLASMSAGPWDIGHFVPSGDFGEECEKANTFCLSNTFPQDPILNRGLWRDLEEQLRGEVSAVAQLWVFALPVFMHRAGNGRHYVEYQVNGADAVAVPTHVATVALRLENDRYTMRAWIAPNRKPSFGARIDHWRVKPDYVEGIAGLDFFSGLEDSLETKLESAK